MLTSTIKKFERENDNLKIELAREKLKKFLSEEN
jgi:hypothetical protein